MPDMVIITVIMVILASPVLIMDTPAFMVILMDILMAHMIMDLTTIPIILIIHPMDILAIINTTIQACTIPTRLL